MTTLTTREVARDFSDTMNRVAYGRERFVLTRRGRPLAVITPIADFEQLKEAVKRLAVAVRAARKDGSSE